MGLCLRELRATLIWSLVKAMGTRAVAGAVKMVVFLLLRVKAVLLRLRLVSLNWFAWQILAFECLLASLSDWLTLIKLG